MEQNKRNNPVKLYAIVTQYLMMIVVLTGGGYLLGRYVLWKNSIAGGIMATIGAICGIVLFIMEMLKIGKNK